MLSHPSGTLISHRVAEIISPQPNNNGHRPIFVGGLSNVKTLHANFFIDLFYSILMAFKKRNHVKPLEVQL